MLHIMFQNLSVAPELNHDRQNMVSPLAWTFTCKFFKKSLNSYFNYDSLTGMKKNNFYHLFHRPESASITPAAIASLLFLISNSTNIFG